MSSKKSILFLIKHVALFCLILVATLPGSTQTVDWQHAYGGVDYEHGHGIVKCSSGGYVIISPGGTNSGDVTTGTNGYQDFWIIKTSNNSTIEWTNTFG